MRNIIKKSLFILISFLTTVMAWADTTLFTTDFTTWSTNEYATATFVNGVYFAPKSGKKIKIDGTGVNFDAQNASGKNHVIGIPVSGVNGSITVTISHPYAATSSYKYKAAITEGADYENASPSVADAFSKTLVQTYSNLSGSDYVIWLGEASSSYKVIKTVTITTPSEGGGGGGDTPGGGSSGSDEIIKVVLSGDRASTQTVTGTIGGTSAVKNMGSSSPYKLNSDGAYVSLVLATGYFEATDTLILDGSKAMLVYYGPAESGTQLLTTAGPNGGIIRTPLTNLPANQNSIYVYRTSSTYNGTLTYMAVHRPKAAGLSNDAKLSALTYDGGTSVPNFSPSQEHYDVELPANYVGVPSIQGTPNHANATISDLTQVTSIPGTASITVTAEDGTTTKTYTVTFTRESAEPKVESATWDNIFGTAAIDQVNKTITGQVINGSSLTLTPQFGGKNIDYWTPVDAQDFSTGFKNYVFFSSTTESTQYTVTITEAPAISTDATLRSLTYGGTSVPNFSPTIYEYNIQLPAGTTTPPTIAATATDSKANVQITQAPSVTGTGTVVVTAEDGTTKLTYTINYSVPVQPSGLTTHRPKVYEAKKNDGGYGGRLSVANDREFEVYYGSFDEKDSLSITVSPEQKSKGITYNTSKTAFNANDGWFKGEGASGKSNFTFTNNDEFKAGAGALHKLVNGNEYLFDIEGYDQFTIMGKDNHADASKGRHLEVYIDDVLQPMSLATTHTIRRFTFAAGKHVIRVKAVHDGSGTSEISAFSLRLPQRPETKYMKGDSAQEVLQTEDIKKVVYTTKYNNIPGAETRLEWDGNAISGITLHEAEGDMVDTLTLRGTANCPVGTYKYAVVAYLNDVEMNRVTGTFKVVSDIRATSDINVTVYQTEEMDPITFKYYALSANDVTLSWTSGTPGGTVKGSGSNGKYIIGGVPANVGIFPYEISVLGADTIIKGKLTVKELNYGTNPVLYLQRKDDAYENDAVYQYLANSNNWNMIARKQKADGLRPITEYQRYKWVLISEDVDADNAEAIQLIRGGASLPVLNLKGYTYATDGLDDETRLGWGDPNSGAIDSTAKKVNGCKIKIEQPTHPIFAKMSGVTKGAEVTILDGYTRNGIMPIHVTKQGTLCLATGYTRSMTEYYGVGDLETAIHEVPADMRGGKKYICLSMGSTATLNTQGQKLIDGIIDYLLSSEASPIQIPTTQIMQFTVAGIDADIDHAGHSIVLKMTLDEYIANDSLRAAKPVITLADPANTHVSPGSEEEVDLRFTALGLLTKKYTVSDYINQWTYDFSIRLYTPQGIEETYESGMWVNIYDIYGRKVATTNEDIYSMDLPHGMYIVVTENGTTLKIMR